MATQIAQEQAQCLDQAWRCRRCSSLLGYAMDVRGQTHLRIKVRDQYIWVIEPLAIVVTCRKCSFSNELHQKAGQEESANSQ